MILEKRAVIIFIVFCLAVGGSAQQRGRKFAADLITVRDTLKPLHQTITEPSPGDWLSQHKEKGQTFKQYVRGKPSVADKEKRVIYIQPIGSFTPKQRQVIVITADFMGRYFSMQVKIKKDMPLSVVPDKARRKNPYTNKEQLSTPYILYNVLRMKRPRDAAAYIAFTASDLWPGNDWNYVFGQASLQSRVGVWSIHRLGNPDNKNEYKRCLKRTMKIAVHETGHMFSMAHCTLYECVMCGANHQEESDRRPVWSCPECLPKICWAVQKDPVKRYEKLKSFFHDHGFKEEEKFMEKSIKALSK